MKITIFTSNQPRHITFINRLAEISDQVYAIQECNTVFPGLVQDFFKKSPVMQRYFNRVLEAEKKMFGSPGFLSKNVRSLSIKSGDLNLLDLQVLSPALDSDFYIVFGASYIKGELIEALVRRKAINIHMGLSPYYRGSSCNFWAMYDQNPQMVGATIHLLSKGLDSGPILYHALPGVPIESGFLFTMQAVESAQKSLVQKIASGEIQKYVPVIQDKKLEIRYTRNSDFTDEMAQRYLDRNEAVDDIVSVLRKKPSPDLLNPYQLVKS